MRSKDKRRIVKVIVELHGKHPNARDISPGLILAALNRQLPDYGNKGVLRWISMVASDKTDVLNHILTESHKKWGTGFIPKHLIDEVQSVCGISSPNAKLVTGLWWSALSPPLIRKKLWRSLVGITVVILFSVWTFNSQNQIVSAWKRVADYLSQMQHSWVTANTNNESAHSNTEDGGNHPDLITHNPNTSNTQEGIGSKTALEVSNDIAFADFTSWVVRDKNLNVIPGNGFAYNAQFQNSWRIANVGGGFVAIFNVPGSGRYSLIVNHLSSYVPSSRGNGYSPVTIQLNSKIVAANYDAASSHAGKHGMVTDRWLISVHAGQNELKWTLGMGSSQYWIQSIEIQQESSQSAVKQSLYAQPITSQPSSENVQQPGKGEIQNILERVNQGEHLHVVDIEALSKAGLSDGFIISKIRQSHTIYRLTADDIIALKQTGVSPTVIEFILNTPNANNQ